MLATISVCVCVCLCTCLRGTRIRIQPSQRGSQDGRQAVTCGLRWSEADGQKGSADGSVGGLAPLDHRAARLCRHPWEGLRIGQSTLRDGRCGNTACESPATDPLLVRCRQRRLVRLMGSLPGRIARRCAALEAARGQQLESNPVGARPARARQTQFRLLSLHRCSRRRRARPPACAIILFSFLLYGYLSLDSCLLCADCAGCGLRPNVRATLSKPERMLSASGATFLGTISRILSENSRSCEQAM
jgi:hypothetical protein